MIEFISIIPVISIRFLVPRFLGYVIIGERSLIDFLIWLAMTLRDSGIINSFIGRIIMALAGSMCFNIYVRAELDVLKARRKGSREEPLLALQLALYDIIAKTYGFPIIDTSNKNVEESTRLILDIQRFRGL
jgi:hypothetical protein